MIPVLGQTYAIDIQITSMPKDEYMTDAYFEQDLPLAPAVMVGDEIVVEGTDIDQRDLEAAICRQLDLPPPAAATPSFFKKLFGA